MSCLSGSRSARLYRSRTSRPLSVGLAAHLAFHFQRRQPIVFLYHRHGNFERLAGRDEVGVLYVLGFL